MTKRRPRSPADEAPDPHDPSCCNGPCAYCDAQDALRKQGRRAKSSAPSDPQYPNHWLLLNDEGVEALGRGEILQPLYIVLLNPEDGDLVIRGTVPEHIRVQARSMRNWMRADPYTFEEASNVPTNNTNDDQR